jgi:hypothetical protein
MVERLINIEKKLDILPNIGEKLDILTEEIVRMKDEATELRKSNEFLVNQISFYGNNPVSSESFIKVSIS